MTTPIWTIQLFSQLNSMSYTDALDRATLTDMQKSIIRARYIRVVHGFENRCRMLSIWFHTCRFTVTVGSLIVPALLSIQYTSTASSTNTNDNSDPNSFAYRIYWATWVISLLVTTSNGLSNIYKIDKKYYFLHTTLEQLRSEGWQYFELSGRYSGFFTPHETPTHANQFIYFCHSVEKIKMKQVEEEYYKLLDTHSNTPQTQTSGQAPRSTQTVSNLIPPTPLNTILEERANLPPELLRQLDTIREQTSPSEILITEKAEESSR